MSPPLRVCFVCTGNICRSPMAAAVIRHLAAEEGLDARIEISSAGTGGWHIGQPADRRAAAVLRQAGYSPAHEARQFTPDDFAAHDLVIALDRGNERDLLRMARTDEERAKVRRLRTFDPAAGDDLDVPDPYYDDEAAFRRVLALIEAAAPGVLATVHSGP
jgi:protein-tyrosine phosphatase